MKCWKNCLWKVGRWWELCRTGWTKQQNIDSSWLIGINTVPLFSGHKSATRTTLHSKNPISTLQAEQLNVFMFQPRNTNPSALLMVYNMTTELRLHYINREQLGDVGSSLNPTSSSCSLFRSSPECSALGPVPVTKQWACSITAEILASFILVNISKGELGSYYNYNPDPELDKCLGKWMDRDLLDDIIIPMKKQSMRKRVSGEQRVVR